MISSVKRCLTADESRYLLSKAKEMGFKLRIHADEIESIGGVDVAAELESTSAEHLMVITDEGIQKISCSKSDRQSIACYNLQPHGRYLCTGS